MIKYILGILIFCSIDLQASTKISQGKSFPSLLDNGTTIQMNMPEFRFQHTSGTICNQFIFDKIGDSHVVITSIPTTMTSNWTTVDATAQVSPNAKAVYIHSDTRTTCDGDATQGMTILYARQSFGGAGQNFGEIKSWTQCPVSAANDSININDFWVALATGANVGTPRKYDYICLISGEAETANRCDLTIMGWCE